MPFTMQGAVQFVPRMVDGDAMLSDSVAARLVLANGTGTGQADGYWSGSLTIPADDSETIDLLALAVAVFGASGTTGFSSVKHLFLQNQSDRVSLTVDPGASNGWSQIGATSVGAGGILLLHSPLSGLPVGSTSRTIQVTNQGSVTTLTGNTTSGSANVTGLSSTSGLAAGMTVTGTGIPSGAKIATVTNVTSLVLTANATANGTGVSLNFAWPAAVVDVYVAGVLD